MGAIKPFVFLAPMLVAGFVGWRLLLAPQYRRWVDWRAASVIAVTGAGYVVPGIWFYFALVFGMVAVLPRSRAEAMALFVIAAFMLPFASYHTAIGTMHGIDLSTIGVASLALLPALRFAPEGATVRRGAGADLATIALMVLLTIITTRVAAFSVTVGLRGAFSVITGVGIPYLLLGRLGAGADGLRRVLQALALAGFVLSIVAVFESLHHWPLYGALDDNLGTSWRESRSLAVRAGMLRATGPFSESTGLSVFLAGVATIVAASATLFRSRPAQLLALGVVCCGSLATLARNGWIGLIVGLILVAVYYGRTLRLTMAALVGGIAAMVIMRLATASDRLGAMLGMSGHAENTTEYRQRLLHYATQLVRVRPFAGTSMEDAGVILRPYLRSSQLSVDWVNSYLYFAVGTGVIGLAVFVCYTLAPIVATLRMRRRVLRVPALRELAACVFAPSAAFAVMIFLTSYVDRLPLIGVLLIASARQLSGLLATERRATRAPPAPLVIDPARPRQSVAPEASRAPALIR